MKPFLKTIAAFLAVLIMGAASTAGMKASAAAPQATGLCGRYILSATVTRKGIVTGEDINGNLVTLMFVTFTDTDGENWIYGYELNEKTPPMNQQVILVMNSNGTPSDTDDDIIEDILFADPECDSVD